MPEAASPLGTIVGLLLVQRRHEGKMQAVIHPETAERKESEQQNRTECSAK